MNFDEIKLASIGKRAGAYLIDDIIMSVLFIVAFYDKFTNTNSQEEILAIMSSLVIYLIITKILYQAIFVYYYGATLGKMVFKIKCVTYEGLTPNFTHSFLRGITKIIISSELSLYLGYLWVYFNPAKQTWHDKLAKTLVIDVS